MKSPVIGHRAIVSAAVVLAVVGLLAALNVSRATDGGADNLPAAEVGAATPLPTIASSSGGNPSPSGPSGSSGSAPSGSSGSGTAAGSASSAASTPQLPAPTANLPSVPPMSTLREVDAVVMLPATITAGEVTALEHTAGLSAIEEVDTGTVTFDGAPAATFGVDPGTFRDFTPEVTASESKLWQYVAAGSLAASYDMATDRKLSLGSRLPVVGAGSQHLQTTGWLGAFMSVGIPDVDLVVDHGYSAALGLKPDSGLVVSAPGMNTYELQEQLQAELPGANVEVTHADVNLGSAASTFIPARTMSEVISAALSRVGDAYVWGGNGPSVFDCSGLVGWAYAQAGISMPRTAAQQALAGPRETLAQAQPGDLLFWTYDPSDPTFIDHVAIYLGNGRMVVAPHTGTDVQVDPVPTADFAGAVRVNPTAAASVGGARYP